MQTKHQYYLEIEPTGEVKEREPKEELATANGEGDERGTLQLATVGEVTRQRGVEKLPQGPMPPQWVKELKLKLKL